jgi:hypothetical protein
MTIRHLESTRSKRRGAQTYAAERIRLERDAWGQLILISADGRRHAGVEPVRAFPFSDSEHWVFIRDNAARELLCVENLTDLDPHSRMVLESELARRDFVPVIQRIEYISAHREPTEWRVKTDRGATRFVLSSEDDIRALSEHRMLIADANGIRYVIPDTRALDAASRGLLERYT